MTYSLASPIVELRHVNFAYGERVILHDVSLSVPQGKVTALIGPMGSGKTTMLRVIGGQNRAQSGEVLFEGQDVTRMDAKAALRHAAAHGHDVPVRRALRGHQRLRQRGVPAA